MRLHAGVIHGLIFFPAKAEALTKFALDSVRHSTTELDKVGVVDLNPADYIAASRY